MTLTLKRRDDTEDSRLGQQSCRWWCMSQMQGDESRWRKVPYFRNGQVVTVDEHWTVCEALAVRHNKIVCCGSNAEIDAFQGPSTTVVDLAPESLLPGFIDAHADLVLYGTNQLGVNCKDVHSIEEMMAKLRLAAKMTPLGEWIRGWGYNQNALSEGRHPTRGTLIKFPKIIRS